LESVHIGDRAATSLTIESNIDVSITGFAIAEIDLILQSETDALEEDDTHFSDETCPAVTQTGDLWHLGPHRILCGNALQCAFFSSLLNGHLADMVFVDPPYNVPIDGHATGLGSIKHRDFIMAVGEMPGTVQSYWQILGRQRQEISLKQ
jgi:hypothetical protein